MVQLVLFPRRAQHSGRMTDSTESKNLRSQLSTYPIPPPRVCLKGFLFDNDDLSVHHKKRPAALLLISQIQKWKQKSSEMSCLVSFRRQEKQNTSLDFLGKQLIADKVLNTLDFSTNHITLLVTKTILNLLSLTTSALSTRKCNYSCFKTNFFNNQWNATGKLV